MMILAALWASSQLIACSRRLSVPALGALRAAAEETAFIPIRR
jgi:hypothetical protein